MSEKNTALTAKLTQLYKDDQADLYLGIMLGIYPDYANVNGALCDMAEDFEMSFEELAQHLAVTPNEHFTVTMFQLSTGTGGYDNWPDHKWLPGHLANGYFTDCEAMISHYLQCVAAGKDVKCDWAEELKNEYLEQQAEEELKNH